MVPEMGSLEPVRPLVQRPEEQGPPFPVIEYRFLTVTDEKTRILQHVEDPSHVPLQNEIIDTAAIPEIVQDTMG